MEAGTTRHAWSMPVRRRPAAGMAAGAAALAIGDAAWLLLPPLIHPQAVFLFLIPAAVIASAFGGLVPGLAVAALGTALGLGLNGRPDPGDLLSAGLFLATAMAVAVGGEWFQRAWDRPRPPTPSWPSARRISLDPRHRPGRDDRHRRARPDPLVQPGGRAAVRLDGRGGDRPQRQHADAVALSRAARRLPATATTGPASGGSSASAGSWSASARTARPFRWSCRSARCTRQATAASSPASSAT